MIKSVFSEISTFLKTISGAEQGAKKWWGKGVYASSNSYFLGHNLIILQIAIFPDSLMGFQKFILFWIAGIFLKGWKAESEKSVFIGI